MADRVKYFLLGLLFLVVAGVIAYDRWNSDPAAPGATEEAAADRGSASVGPIDPFPPAPEPEGDGRDLRVLPDDEGGRAGPIDLPLPRPPIEDDTPPAPRPGPGPTPPRPEPEPDPAPAPKAATHVVQPGETLEVIALQYYKTRDGIAWIAEANAIQDVNRIRVKQKLIIPARKETARSGRTAPGANAPRTARTIPEVYEVKAGEDLYEICRRFYGSKGQGARVDRIMELNHLWSAEVRAGTKLRLPRE